MKKQYIKAQVSGSDGVFRRTEKDSLSLTNQPWWLHIQITSTINSKEQERNYTRYVICTAGSLASSYTRTILDRNPRKVCHTRLNTSLPAQISHTSCPALSQSAPGSYFNCNREVTERRSRYVSRRTDSRKRQQDEGRVLLGVVSKSWRDTIHANISDLVFFFFSQHHQSDVTSE